MTRALTTHIGILTIAFLCAPIAAYAFATGGFVDTVVLSLDGAIGAFGAFAIVIFTGGFTLYIVRLGTERRQAGIDLMRWGISTLFVVVIMIYIARWLQ